MTFLCPTDISRPLPSSHGYKYCTSLDLALSSVLSWKDVRDLFSVQRDAVEGRRVGKISSGVQISFMNILIEKNRFVHQLPSYYLQWLPSHYLQVRQISCIRYCVLSLSECSHGLHVATVICLYQQCHVSPLVTGAALKGIEDCVIGVWVKVVVVADGGIEGLISSSLSSFTFLRGFSSMPLSPTF